MSTSAVGRSKVPGLEALTAHRSRPPDADFCPERGAKLAVACVGCGPRARSLTVRGGGPERVARGYGGRRGRAGRASGRRAPGITYLRSRPGSSSERLSGLRSRCRSSCRSCCRSSLTDGRGSLLGDRSSLTDGRSSRGACRGPACSLGAGAWGSIRCGSAF